MKKVLTVLMILTFASTMIFGQTAIPMKGDKIVGAKLALDDAGGADMGFLGTFELGMTDDLLNLDGIPTSLGVGATIGFSSDSHSYYDFNTLLVGGNGLFHIDFLGMDKLDTYVKAEFNFYRWSYNFDNEYLDLNRDNSETDFDVDFGIGARYYFSNNLAAVVELGSGFGSIRVGVDLKL